MSRCASESSIFVSEAESRAAAPLKVAMLSLAHIEPQSPAAMV
eukprot:CAMPEP_0201666308 /NCGR_PEP_ID=MMETSP0494-20130426/7184_1 /ASSEMBLY_ACC=CAM_ASM_000839 /TAXON_ID=420259 /ORGANISM="Thalassiosira gravida, Strain GMp14c1" /LENGTH=42 /DNA_ID= /DNA_START= /DNA_END= /DNA_ORIENTATION=